MTKLMMKYCGLALLYLLAAPVYAVFAVQKLVKFWRIRQVMLAGRITCVHCGAANHLDVLATCRRCKTTEYGNRLRCSTCGDMTKGFDCDVCGVTLRVL